MIDVAGLQALRAVAAWGTLASAADDLGYTASAVSQQIKRLERQLGVPVLAPAGRGVVLTPAGRALVEAAPEVFHALERCTEAARGVADGLPTGVLRVAGFSTAIRGLLAPALARMASDSPQLRVDVTEADPEEAMRAVEVGGVDVALLHDADGLPVSAPATLTRQHVHTDLGDIVAPRAHPLAALRRPLRADDLAGHTWVTSPPGTVCHQWFRRLLAGESEPDVRHLVDDFATQVALVDALGVVALIPRLARPPIPPSLVVVPLDRAPTREVHACWRRSADASPGIRALLAALRPVDRVLQPSTPPDTVPEGEAVGRRPRR